MPKIVRHLVDEKGLARAIDARVRKILLPEAFEVVGFEFSEYSRVARSRILGFAALQVLDHAKDIGEFHGPFDLRVRSENLFEQGRARPRQADYEDRRRTVAAHSLPRVEEVPSANFRLQSGVTLERLGPVATFAFFQRIAARVIFEGFGIFGTVLEGLAEGKTQMIAVLQPNTRRGFVRTHACDFRVREPVGLEVGKTPIRVAKARSRRRSRAIRIDGFSRATDCFQSMRNR